MHANSDGCVRMMWWQNWRSFLRNAGSTVRGNRLSPENASRQLRGTPPLSAGRTSRARSSTRIDALVRGRRRWSGRPCIVLLLVFTGCGRPDAHPEAAKTVRLPGGDSVIVEPYRSPPGFPLPFHTVLPEGFRAEPNLDPPGAALRFTWFREGERRDSAFLYVRVMQEGAGKSWAREIVRTAAERLRIPGNRTELEPREGHRWAVEEYRLRSVGTFGEPVQGWVALGRRQGRWFYVISQAPVEAWARFEPRAELILSEWRWAGPDGRPGMDGLEERP